MTIIREVFAGLVLVAVAVAFSACGYHSNPPQPQRHGMDAICAGIQAELARRSDVVWVFVWYADSSTDPSRSAYAAVELAVHPDVALDPVVDAAAAAVWRSRLTPLRSIEVNAWEHGNTDRWEFRDFAASGKDEAALETRYGPRPAR